MEENKSDLEVRITYRCEIFLKGKDLKEIERKWHYLEIFPQELKEKYGADFIEVVSVENSDTNEDLKPYW